MRYVYTYSLWKVEFARETDASRMRYFVQMKGQNTDYLPIVVPPRICTCGSTLPSLTMPLSEFLLNRRPGWVDELVSPSCAREGVLHAAA